MSGNSQSRWLGLQMSCFEWSTDQTQRHKAYYQRRLRKPVNVHFWEAVASAFMIFCHDD